MVIVTVLFTGTSEMCIVLVLFAIILLTALVQTIYVNSTGTIYQTLVSSTIVLVLFTRPLFTAPVVLVLLH